MGEGLTRELHDGRSFEERVLARFDAMEMRFNARFDSMDLRFDGLDRRVQVLEAKAFDTKPIWEQALAEILEVRKGVEDLNRKFDVLTQDVMQVRADHRRVDKRMDELETRLH